jgi:hypothetical protein
LLARLPPSTRISLETNVTKAMAFQMKPRNRYCFLRWDWWMVYPFAKKRFENPEFAAWAKENVV